MNRPATLGDLVRQGYDVSACCGACGHAATDHRRIMALAEAAYAFAAEVLAPGVAFVCKVLQGGAERALLEAIKGAFESARHVKPPASRAESAELYVVALGFRGAPPAERRRFAEPAWQNSVYRALKWPSPRAGEGGAQLLTRALAVAD